MWIARFSEAGGRQRNVGFRLDLGRLAMKPGAHEDVLTLSFTPAPGEKEESGPSAVQSACESVLGSGELH